MPKTVSIGAQNGVYKGPIGPKNVNLFSYQFVYLLVSQSHDLVINLFTNYSEPKVPTKVPGPGLID